MVPVTTKRPRKRRLGLSQGLDLKGDAVVVGDDQAVRPPRH